MSKRPDAFKLTLTLARLACYTALAMPYIYKNCLAPPLLAYGFTANTNITRVTARFRENKHPL